MEPSPARKSAENRWGIRREVKSARVILSRFVLPCQLLARVWREVRVLFSGSLILLPDPCFRLALLAGQPRRLSLRGSGVGDPFRFVKNFGSYFECWEIEFTRSSENNRLKHLRLVEYRHSDYLGLSDYPPQKCQYARNFTLGDWREFCLTRGTAARQKRSPSRQLTVLP